MSYNVKAFDDGFGDGKGYDGKNETIIPSFVTRWQPIPEGEFDKLRYSEPDSHITVEFDGKMRIIGKYAQQSDKEGMWNGEKNKHRSSQFIPLMKGQLALLCQDEFSKEVHIDPLIMGLPLDQDTVERKREVASIVKGRHEVKVTMADGTIIDKDIYVDSIRFVSQPMGSFFYKVLNDGGRVKDESMLSQTTLVVDLGARTLNTLTLRGFSTVPELSGTRQLGIYGAWDSIREDIKNIHQKDLPISRIPQNCENGYVSGGVDIRGLRDDNYNDHADKILSHLGTEFITNASEIDNVILTGGGSMVLRKWLEPGIKNLFKQANIETLGRTATVKGYYNFGVRITHKDQSSQQDAQSTPSKGFKEVKEKSK